MDLNPDLTRVAFDYLAEKLATTGVEALVIDTFAEPDWTAFVVPTQRAESVLFAGRYLFDTRQLSKCLVEYDSTVFDTPGKIEGVTTS